MRDLVLVQLPNPGLEHQMYHALGILYLAAVVEQAGYSVEIADLRHGDVHIPQAKYYGFSATTPEIIEAKKLAQEVKGKTIVGGGHPSLLTEDCIGHFDYIVVGEGEEVILDILGGKRKPGVIIAPRLKDLNKLPFPARHKVKQPYNNRIFPGERYGIGALTGTLIATRGCPFLCSYCGNIFRATSSRSVQNIIDEMKLMIDDGVTHFKFMDDCFTLHPQFEELCRAIKKLNIHYIAHCRSDLLTARKVELLATSGCWQMGMGVESADDTVLKINHKQETVEEHKQAIKMLKSVGIKVKPYWVTGLPGETDKTIELNKQFMVDTRPYKWTLSTFTPYPGCDIYKNPDKYGVIITEQDFTKWWNYCHGRYNHILVGQTAEEMWTRYLDFKQWLLEEKWMH